MSKRSAKEIGQDKTHPLWTRCETRFVDTMASRFQRASWESCRRQGMWLGLAFHNAVAGRRRIAIENIRLAFPDVSTQEATGIARRACQNLFMTTCESLHMGAASRAEIDEYSQLLGGEHLRAALEQGHGAITLSAHFGNWELLAAQLATAAPLTVMARPNSNPEIERHVTTMRERFGVSVLSKWESARGSIRVLRKGELLGLLPDQRAGKSEGILLPMFGHRTRFYTSVAQLALMSGAPIIPSFGVRREPWISDGGIDGTCFPALPASTAENRDDAVEEVTKHVIAALEKIVRAHPDQWWWIHRRWRTADCDTLPLWAKSLRREKRKKK